MERMSLKDLSVPLIKSIDSFNYLLKSHHRRTAIISYYLGKELGLSSEEMTLLIIAASLHDIGALSVQERNLLIQEDVENPEPHCVMGYKMLANFDAFKDVAQIIKHHHIVYAEVPEIKDEILFQSFIVHLADRVDILISPDRFILDQKEEVYQKIKAKENSLFHPKVVAALEKIKQRDIFWIDINNLSIEQLFERINFSLDMELSIEQVILFSQTLAKIIDFRSQFTISHSYTVAHLSYHMGHQLGYDSEFCNKLLIAGYLHDIGKIGIDPGIIEKKGKLSESEYNQIHLHSYYSGQILNELSKNDWFKDIVKWATEHHEKRDGSGYPYALEGELCEGCKIIEYSDIIAALTEKRPYRDPLTVREALDIIGEKEAEKIDNTVFNLIKDNAEYYQEIVDDSHRVTSHEYLKLEV